jgi:TRAP-type C4-dicarboxylate transport system permease small subunit
MQISYAWATASVPVGALLMLLSSCINLYKMFKSKDGEISKEVNIVC